MARAYAEELARNGVCIILVGPDHPTLADIATSLMHSYGVEAVVAQTHFPLDRAACKPIKEALRGKDIGFLVNCVRPPSSSQNLLETPEQQLLELVDKNIALATVMVRLVLPGMVERSRGAVVNISSAACCRPLPARVTLTASTVSDAGRSAGILVPAHKSVTPGDASRCLSGLPGPAVKSPSLRVQ